MWEQIRSNRRRSIVLAAVIALLLMVMGFVFGEAYFSGGGVFGLLLALIVWSVLSLAAYFQGDRILLGVSGAREIKKSDHPQLFNVVEEMQIASGLPKMPRVYIMDSMALNAFATGRKPENAAVAVTAGLLAKLNRDQLQGVIAHEMSHIVNRDVLFMTMIGIMLGAIVMIAEIFMRSLWFSGGRSSRRYSSSSKGGGQAQALMMVVAIVFAILAPVLAQLIYFAISRRREYLADANAAVLTRYPPGLASALDALRSDTNVLERANKATAPMYIINPLHKAGMKAAELTSTHPPIEERIRILMAMGGAVSYGAYEQAYQRTTQRKSVMPPSALKGDKAQPMRAALAGDEAPKTARQRTREAGDLLRKVNKFTFLPCECGLRLKLPPEFKQKSVKCPRCHRKLSVPKAQ
ncbi:MAG: M48 family metalloprotease [Nitrospiraceae bacterium]|nr:M48 family metalloprotease [Nitrospiraceae bacterium]